MGKDPAQTSERQVSSGDSITEVKGEKGVAVSTGAEIAS
jgi:hypothetical protein